MRITPLDVRKQDFRKAVRGFDCDEVRAFLSTLADEYETVLVDNKQIRELVMEQEDKIQEYQGMERNLRDTLMTAERLMQETRENAGKQGDLIIKDAEMKARQVLEECRLRTEELRREIMGLRKEKEAYLARFKSLAESQVKFVETHQSDFEDLDNRLTDIVDSVVATAGHSRRKTDQPYQGPARQPAVPRNAAAQAGTPELDPFADAARNLSGHGGAGDPVDMPTLEIAPPAAPMEDDVWRDYDPGSRGQDEDKDSGSISDLVSESLAETVSDSAAAASPQSANAPAAKAPAKGGPAAAKDEEPVMAGASKDTI